MSPTQAVAADWDRGLTTILERCARRWWLQIGEPLPCGQSARVFVCTDRPGRDGVLKVAAHEAGATLEAAALRIWNGRGAPRLLGFAGDDGALLLERVRPGTQLPTGADAQAIQSVRETLAGLHACPPHPGHSFPILLRFLDSYWDWSWRMARRAPPASSCWTKAGPWRCDSAAARRRPSCFTVTSSTRTCCSERVGSSPSIPRRASVIRVLTSAFTRPTTRPRAQ